MIRCFVGPTSRCLPSRLEYLVKNGGENIADELLEPKGLSEAIQGETILQRVKDHPFKLSLDLKWGGGWLEHKELGPKLPEVSGGQSLLSLFLGVGDIDTFREPCLEPSNLERPLRPVPEAWRAVYLPPARQLPMPRGWPGSRRVEPKNRRCAGFCVEFRGYLSDREKCFPSRQSQKGCPQKRPPICNNLGVSNESCP